MAQALCIKPRFEIEENEDKKWKGGKEKQFFIGEFAVQIGVTFIWLILFVTLPVLFS